MAGNALDQIISHFGVANVAEMTGRKTRLVTADGQTRQENRARTQGVNHDQAPTRPPPLKRCPPRHAAAPCRADAGSRAHA
eukprot:6166603-Prymnesium_polylepis.1